ncbi:MAG: glycoside hydrolase family 31 protein [Massiliimalia sp.]
MKQKTITFLPGEYWYGIRSNDGIKMPLSAQSSYRADIQPNTDPNQCNPLLLSSKGRCIWSEEGFSVICENGQLQVSSKRTEVIVETLGNTLKEAFLEASRRFFPANGVVPPKEFFTKPQYNTWIELMYDQSQEGVLTYAENILKQGLPAGILMIDDGWALDYGVWEFNRNTFPDPKAMVDKLHQMGFEVMLWTCPFLSPDCKNARDLWDQGLLVKNPDGSLSLKLWWNGFSVVLDGSNPKAMEWYHEQNRRLMEEYGIDGFKFDAGDGSFYSDDDLTFQPITANGQTKAWAKVGLDYPYNEYRACYGMAGTHLVQRLADKLHSWSENGVSSLVPNELCQGILGYAFTCPDMIGGGEYKSFLSHSDSLDEELFVRYAQCAALMPMMQFSAAPWRVLSQENSNLCVQAAKMHIDFSERFWDLACHAAKTGEPIVRYLEYVFPGQGLEQVTDCFMLGDTILVAPVLEKGARMRQVSLPKGIWKYVNGTTYEGGKTVEVPAPLDCLPYFEKIG